MLKQVFIIKVGHNKLLPVSQVLEKASCMKTEMHDISD